MSRETGGYNPEQDQKIIEAPDGASLEHFLNSLEDRVIVKKGKVIGRFNGQTFTVDYIAIDSADGGQEQRKKIYEQLGVALPVRPVREKSELEKLKEKMDGYLKT